MNYLNQRSVAVNNDGGLATGEDYCKLFAKDIESLYLLSLLLTGNNHTAEQCFLESLDECLNGVPEFHQRADLWARRVIVRHALRGTVQHAGPWGPISGGSDSADQGIFPEPSLQSAAIARVLALEDLERSVFVLSILEGYSTQRCAVLLAISRREVLEARVRGLQHIADFAVAHALLRGDSALPRVNGKGEPFHEE